MITSPLRPARRMASVGLSEIVRVSEAAAVLKATGRAFGLPGYFRLSYAYDEASLARARDAITRFCASLS